MGKGLYATITRFPFSESAAVAMMEVGARFVDVLESKGTLGTVLNEAYGMTTDLGELNSFEEGDRSKSPHDSPIRIGSAWWLQCFENHEFHYHNFSSSNTYLSHRRILFFADKGFTIEVFPIDMTLMTATGPLELFELDGPAFAELEFDGRFVHRFRPLEQGNLYAYSVHIKDLSDETNAAEVQTHVVEGVFPDRTVRHIIAPPN